MTRILYVVAGFVAFPALLFLAAMCIDEAIHRGYYSHSPVKRGP